jgi:hypothetical protein
MATRAPLPSVIYRSPKRGQPTEALIHMEHSYRMYEKLQACKRSLKEAKEQIRELSRAVRILQKSTQHRKSR